MNLRVVSWNIRHGGRSHATAIAAQLRSWQPDLLVLQEHRGLPEIERAVLDAGLEHLLCAPCESGLRNRVLLASRHRMKRVPTPINPMPERVVAARVATPKLELQVVGLHVPNRDSGFKYEFLSAIAAHYGEAQAGHTLIIGDMNSGIRGIDDETSFFNKRESGWIAAFSEGLWCDAYRRVHGSTRTFSWRSNRGAGFRLDHAFLTASLAPRLCRCDYHWSNNASGRNSDHAALLLDFS